MIKDHGPYGVHMVPSCGFARAYVLEGENGLAVVDVGSVGTAQDVAAFITSGVGRSLGDVRFILATHFHIDHIGGIGRLLRYCPGETKVLFHHLVEDYLSGKRKLSLISNWVVGLMPATLASTRYLRKISHLHYESLAGIPLPGLRNVTSLPFSRDRIVYFAGQGRMGNFGFNDWEIIETPGHTEDSVCFYHESSGELVCGDLILNMRKGGHGYLNRFYWNRKAAMESYHHLCRAITPRVIYPGHGEVIIDDEDALRRVKTFT